MASQGLSDLLARLSRTPKTSTNHLVALNGTIRRRSETKISNLLTYPQTPDLLVVLSAAAFRAAAAARNPDKLSRLGAATSDFLGGAVAHA